MKHLIKLLLVFLIVLLAGCRQVKRAPRDNRLTIIGSGNVVSQEVNLSGFDQVETGFSFNLTIHQGEEFSVIISVDDNLVEYLHVEKRGNILSIGLKPDYAYDIPQATMRAEVTMPDLAELRLSGSSHATLVGIQSIENFEAELSGSSSLEGELEAYDSSFNLSGSTYVKLVGSSRNLDLDACGNSVIDLSEYRVEDAALHLSCDSATVVNVEGRLDIDASQNSFVYYLGHPSFGDVITVEYASVEAK